MKFFFFIYALFSSLFFKEINHKHFYVKDIFHLLQSIKYILPFHIQLTMIIHRVSEKKTSGKCIRACAVNKIPKMIHSE